MTIERTRALLKAATKQQRVALRKECEARIATWDWGTFMRHHVEPDFMLRHKWRRGALLPGPPNPPVAAAYGHAFDAEGRMVVEHKQIPSDDIYESFWVWSETQGVGTHFPPAKSAPADHVSVYTLGVNGRIERVDTVHAEGGALTTVYEYDDAGQWVRARMTGRYNDDERSKADRLDEVERDAKGRLQRLWITQESGHRWAQIDKTKSGAKKPKTAAKKPKTVAKKPKTVAKKKPVNKSKRK